MVLEKITLIITIKGGKKINHKIQRKNNKKEKKKYRRNCKRVRNDGSELKVYSNFSHNFRTL